MLILSRCTSIQVYDLVMGPLRPAEKAAYYEETKRFAALFGIPEAVLPPTVRYLPAYLDARRRVAGGTTPHPMIAVMDRVLRVALR